MSLEIPKLPAGVHRGIPPGQYHGVKWAASASQLRVIHNGTPAHLWADLQKPRVPTWEMALGELVHQLILEPGRPLPQIAVVPESYVVPADYKGGPKDPKPGDVEAWNWRRKYCREWRQTMEAAGLIVVEKDDSDEIRRAAERIHANPEARDLLAGAETEVTLYWETVCGFPCKARLDMLPAGVFLGDLKTTADASPSGWQRHAWNMGYHLQAAFYLDGWAAVGDRNFDGFKFIAYERGVGLVQVHRCTTDLIQAGREAYLDALETYMRCVRSGVWPGYSEEAVEWDLPKWERRAND